MLKDRQINAFATLGGYIGVNAGLVLAAEREDEVAAVLSHEIAHVTQQHVLRGVERAQRDQIPILLGMLGAIVLRRRPLAALPAAMPPGRRWPAAMGLMPSARSTTPAATNPKPTASASAPWPAPATTRKPWPDSSRRMRRPCAAIAGGERERTPDYLQTHPVTTTRISEATPRAEQMTKENSMR